jgi:hypothetical protein
MFIVATRSSPKTQNFAAHFAVMFFENLKKADELLTTKTVFSDEATFHLSEYVNRHALLAHLLRTTRNIEKKNDVLHKLLERNNHILDPINISVNLKDFRGA